MGLRSHTTYLQETSVTTVEQPTLSQPDGATAPVLAFILYKYFPFGGLQRDFIRIAEICRDRGYQIRVYTFGWQGDIPQGFDVVIVPKKGLSSHTKNHNFLQWIDEHTQQNSVELRIGFNKMPELDVYYAADGCYESRASELYTGFSGWFYRKGGRYKHFSAYEAAVFGGEYNTQVLMISDLQKPIFQRFYGTPDKRITMLPPGIARDRCAPDNGAGSCEMIRAEFRREFNIADDEQLLLMVGSGFKTKGVDRSIEAVAALPDGIREKTHLFAIGQDKPDQFNRMAASAGIGDRFRIFAGRDDIPRFMQGADFLIHPARHENTGTVLLEAVVAGLPVMVTDVCGYARYVTEADAGEVLESPFVQARYNRNLARLLESDEKQRQAWRDNGIAYSQQADIYDMPVHAANAIEAALSHSRRGSKL